MSPKISILLTARCLLNGSLAPATHTDGTYRRRRRRGPSGNGPDQILAKYNLCTFSLAATPMQWPMQGGWESHEIVPNLVVRPVKAHLERGNIWQRRREDPHRELNQTYGLAERSGGGGRGAYNYSRNRNRH